MKILLTGISGNLGFEVASKLLEQNVEIIPLVRNVVSVPEPFTYQTFQDIIEFDLLSGNIINPPSQIDAIVHCAGIVHFKKAENNNERMLKKIVELARLVSVPIYFVSTAFTYRPQGEKFVPNNSYEQDKYNCEHLLKSEKIPNAIIRPSVLTGNSRTGAIRSFTGYYSLLKGLMLYAREAAREGRTLRVPKFIGYSDIIPIDTVAQGIANIVTSQKLEDVYYTNPNPPEASWLLTESIDYFNLNKAISVEDHTFKEFESLDMSTEEKEFHKFSRHFLPYWEMQYRFPRTNSTDFTIDHEYLKKILEYFTTRN